MDLIGGSRELQEINCQISWVESELNKNISPKLATELRIRLNLEQKRLNQFDKKYDIDKSYL